MDRSDPILRSKLSEGLSDMCSDSFWEDGYGLLEIFETGFFPGAEGFYLNENLVVVN